MSSLTLDIDITEKLRNPLNKRVGIHVEPRQLTPLILYLCSLSVTLISRLMLRLRSDRRQLHRYSRTERRATANSRFNSTLSEPSSFWFPTIMTAHNTATTERFELESTSSGGAV